MEKYLNGVDINVRQHLVFALTTLRKGDKKEETILQWEAIQAGCFSTSI
jgi:hypothetical protein